MKLPSPLSLCLSLALTPLLLACPSGDPEPGLDTDDTSDSDSTDDDVGTDSTDGTETGTADQGTETGTGTETETETETETTADTSSSDTSEPMLPEEVVTACEEACELVESCDLPIGMCLEECLSFHETYLDDPECLQAELDLTSCLGGLTCEEFEQYAEGEPEPYPCQEEEELICEGGDEDCVVGGDQGEKPGDCSYEEICEDGTFEVACTDGEGCVCLEDGEQVGACSDDAAVCMNFGDPEAIEDCCF